MSEAASSIFYAAFSDTIWNADRKTKVAQTMKRNTNNEKTTKAA